MFYTGEEIIFVGRGLGFWAHWAAKWVQWKILISFHNYYVDNY